VRGHPGPPRRSGTIWCRATFGSAERGGKLTHYPTISHTRVPEFLASAWRHRELVWQLTRREIVGRYRGTVLGLLWTLVHPLFMVGIYTFVFREVFRARWEHEVGGPGEFALVLFAGLIVFSLLTECINRAPWLIVGNPSFVKKVVFPLEVLPWPVLGSALFHATVSFALLFALWAVSQGSLPWTAIALPLPLIPLALLTLGLSWFLAACGAYLRDTAQTVGLLTVALLFMSPVFYPTSALPERYRAYLWLNPLTFVIEEVRGILFLGQAPSWRGLAAQTVLGFAAAWIGWWCFEKARPGFADVL
jgi:homopolymeric O-antigen transport system permease protein